MHFGAVADVWTNPHPPAVALHYYKLATRLCAISPRSPAVSLVVPLVLIPICCTSKVKLIVCEFPKCILVVHFSKLATWWMFGELAHNCFGPLNCCQELYLDIVYRCWSVVCSEDPKTMDEVVASGVIPYQINTKNTWPSRIWTKTWFLHSACRNIHP